MLRVTKASEQSQHDGRPGEREIIAREWWNDVQEWWDEGYINEDLICELTLCCRERLTVCMTREQIHVLECIAGRVTNPFTTLFDKLSGFFNSNPPVVNAFPVIPLGNGQKFSYSLGPFTHKL